MRFLRRLGRRDDIGDRMRSVAALFVETAERFGITFDYSEASVELLEDWVDHLWGPEGPAPTEAELDSNTKLAGAYLGEVMIRHAGGRWAWASDPHQPAIEMSPGRTALVLNKVYKRQVNGPHESLVDFYAEYRRMSRGG